MLERSSMPAKKFCSDATAPLLLCRLHFGWSVYLNRVGYAGPDQTSRRQTSLVGFPICNRIAVSWWEWRICNQLQVPGRRNVSCQLRFDLGGRFFHRASAARRAISDRCSAVNFCALALPPTKPPRRPSDTAAGFLCFSGSASGWRTRAPRGLSWLVPRTFFPIFLHKNDAAGFLDNSKNLLCNLNDFFPFVCG
jgi:hypothetical protein